MLRAAGNCRIRGTNFRLKRKILKDLDEEVDNNSAKKSCLDLAADGSIILASSGSTPENADADPSQIIESHEVPQELQSFRTENEIFDGSSEESHPCENSSQESVDIPPSRASTSNSPIGQESIGGEIPKDTGNASSDQAGDPKNINTDVKRFVKKFPLPFRHVDGLLKMLHTYHPSLPLSHKTLMNDGKKRNIETFASNSLGHEAEFVYFGIAENLRRIVNPELHKDRKIRLQISFDGLPLFKSSRREFWPILAKIYVEGNPYNPFVIAVHSGYGKPKDIHQYLWKFVREINTLLARGIEIENEHWDVEIMAFVCDTPARAYVKCTQGHAGFHACEHCTIVGFKVDGTTVFPVTAAELRTDASFRMQSDPDHHNGDSPLLLIKPSVDMIRLFVLDFMHLVCLGVTKRLLTEYWMVPSLKFLNREKILRLSLRLTNFNKLIPVDFQRTTRELNEIHQWKATEYRFFVLYGGMLVLKDLLPEKAYKHFLLLSIACRILCSQDYFKKYHAVAKQCLDLFVKSAQHPDLYGLKILVINLHNLLHLADQVEFMGAPLMDISAFDFENILGKIKKFILSGNKPLSQLCSKINHYLDCEKPAKPTHFEILAEKKPDRMGEVAIKKIKLYGSELSLDEANSVVLLKDGVIARIISMSTSSESRRIEEISVKAKKIEIVGSALEYPIDSSLLNMYRVNEIETNQIISTTLDSIKCKMIKLDVFEVSGDPKESYAMPLLHMN